VGAVPDDYRKYFAYLEKLRNKGDDILAGKLQSASVDLDEKACRKFLRLVGIRGLTAPEHIDADTSATFGICGDTAERIEAAWRVAWELLADDPEVIDRAPVDALVEAREHFQTYETEIAAALLLAGLPEAYAAKDGVRVLAVTNQLGSNPKRRVRATASWLLSVLGPDGTIEDDWGPAGMSFRAVVGLRLFHQVVRTTLTLQRDIQLVPGGVTLADFLGPANTTAVNQEDLIATRLTFSIGVFEVLEKFGIAWSEDGQASYLAAWNFIGHCLGIVDEWPAYDDKGQLLAPPSASPRPESVTESRRLLAAIRQHQWPPAPPWRTGSQPTDVPAEQATNVPADQPGDVAEAILVEQDTVLVDEEGRTVGELIVDEVLIVKASANGGEPDPDKSLQGVVGALEPGRELADALLEELSQAMLPAGRRWPRALMQVLNPPVVVDRLGLGAPGFPLEALSYLPPLYRRIGSFTRISQRNPVTGATLRFMANEVARRAVVSFVDTTKHAPFVLPGLEEWSSGIRPG
jgi:hypothetical protein